MSKRVFEQENFGAFLPYLEDEHITDITWNGKALWIDNIDTGRHVTDVVLDEKFVDSFSLRVAMYAGRAFNAYNPVLETQIGLFRVSIVNDAFAHTGTSIAIRRTSDKCRLVKEECIEKGFCDEATWNFLPKIVRSGISCIAGGQPGVGKTEVLKLLSTYIPPEQRAIIMEDSPEFHYSSINPESDCTEWIIDDLFPYEIALKTSLRQRPEWNILAEVRGRETQFLMENFSSGINVLTSAHLDNEDDLIPRLENMVGDPALRDRVRNEIYMRGLAVFVIDRKITNNGIFRKLAQLCFYSNEPGVGPTKTMVVENGVLTPCELPVNIKKKFLRGGYADPFANLVENKK